MTEKNIWEFSDFQRTFSKEEQDNHHLADEDPYYLGQLDQGVPEFIDEVFSEADYREETGKFESQWQQEEDYQYQEDGYEVDEGDAYQQGIEDENGYEQEEGYEVRVVTMLPLKEE